MNEQETRLLKRHLRITEKANLEIRDQLAIERTEFANERTFLSYVRTALGLVLAGLSLIQFFGNEIFVWVGIAIVPGGIFLALLGLRKFLAKRKQITTHRTAYIPLSHLHARIAEQENLLSDSSSNN